MVVACVPVGAWAVVTKDAKQKMRITPNASIALDLLRGAAAMTVFLHHANMFGLDGGALAWFRRDVGHSAVVIFFVLSGYVIAATLRPGGGALDYAIRRAARIYSVAIPAVLLTWLLDLAMVRWNISSEVPAYQLYRPWLYFPIDLSFAGQFWRLSEPAFSNTPYWSLTYEVWYYVVFAIAVFARGLARWFLLAATIGVMGPKLGLLMPIWLGGVAVAYLWKQWRMPRGSCRLLVLVTLGLFVLAKGAHLEDRINDVTRDSLSGLLPFPLGFSQWFAGDYGIGLLTMGLVYGLNGAEFSFSPWLAARIAWFANLSFGLYVAHYPLLLLWHGLMPGHGWIAMGLALACALAFAAMVEPQKDRLKRILVRSSARWLPGQPDESTRAAKEPNR